MDNTAVPVESWNSYSPGGNVITAPGGHDTITHIWSLLIFQG